MFNRYVSLPEGSFIYSRKDGVSDVSIWQDDGSICGIGVLVDMAVFAVGDV